ncbi:hypothetical protein BDZ45DRAFT_811688 [Acephala macrosclerotiorum]|nr:hypothetical protein BDZ45DRAFT_811688 [Acephala macrosclerotiorum]
MLLLGWCTVTGSRLIDEAERQTKLDTKRRKDTRESWIYTKLTLYSYYSGAVAAFNLTLHRGYPYIEDDYKYSDEGDDDRPKNQDHEVTPAGLLIQSLSNEWTSDCKACEKCIITSSPSSKVNWDATKEHGHCRWTKYPASNVNLVMIRSWLQQCIECHTACNSRKVSSKPTRILDLRDFEKGYIRLAPGTDIGQAQYATLSYSWGGCQEFVLRRSNVEDFEKSIAVEVLPKTFRDAVIISRRLGFDFLWSSLDRYGSDAKKFRKAWHQVVNAYSKTDLTHKADKLVAIAGIAGLVQRHRNIIASFGLWLDFFDTELMWKATDGGLGRPISWSQNLAIAPSWAWASVHGAKVSNEWLRLSGFMQETKMARVIKIPEATPFSHVQYDQQMGTASKYAITLIGSLCHCRAVSYFGREKDSPVDYLYPHHKGDQFEESRGDFTPDLPLPQNDQIPLYCLLVARFQHEDNDCVDLKDLGIVLTPINIAENLFRRVGFYSESAMSTGKGRRMFRDYHWGSASTVHVI